HVQRVAASHVEQRLSTQVAEQKESEFLIEARAQPRARVPLPGEGIDWQLGLVEPIRPTVEETRLLFPAGLAAEYVRAYGHGRSSRARHWQAKCHGRSRVR